MKQDSSRRGFLAWLSGMAGWALAGLLPGKALPAGKAAPGEPALDPGSPGRPPGSEEVPLREADFWRPLDS